MSSPGGDMPFPGSRTLAGWWRQFAPRSPQRLWVGHLLVQRLEVLVRVTRPATADPLSRLVLRALGVAPGTTPAALDARLHLGGPVVGGLLEELYGGGLVRHVGEGSWGLTALGRQAAASETYPRPLLERRSFAFLDARPFNPPHFLALPENLQLPPWPEALADFGGAVGVAQLREAVARPSEWKERFGFPAEVGEVLGMEEPAGVGNNGESPPAAWRRVPVVRPERLTAALVLGRDDAGESKLMAFAARSEGWTVPGTEPTFALPPDSPALPVDLRGPGEEAWSEAWRAGCRSRNLSEAEGCPVEPEGHVLRVRLSAELYDRLKASRHELLKGDTWLLAGEGRVRAAALVEVGREEG